MNPAQRAVLALAQKEGRTPMEQSAEFMLHDLVQACLDVIKGQKKLYSELGEQQQDSVIAGLSTTLKETVYTAASILAGADVVRVPFLLQDFKAGKDLKLTGIIDAQDPGRFQLMDKAHSKAKVVIVLQDMEYFAGMDNIQSDKDQKTLPLESDAAKPASNGKGKAAAEPKPVQIVAKTLEQARDFVIIQQNTTRAGLQNFLKCDVTKAEAYLQALEDEGTLTAKAADGNRKLIRKQDQDQDGDGLDGLDDGGDEFHADDLEADEKGFTVLSDEVFIRARDKVVKDQRVSAEGLAIAFDLTTEDAATLMDRLELDGVISVEDDLGGRTIMIPAVAE